MQALPNTAHRFPRAGRLVAGLLLALSVACASTSSGAGADVRAIDDIPTLEALAPDARPVIKVSVRQQGSANVPAEYRWMYDFRSNSGNVASGQNLETRLVDALVASNRFHVRTTNFEDLQQEKDLQASGDLREDSEKTGGNVVKAQYSILATVTDFNYAEEGSKSGVSGWLPGRVRRAGIGRESKVATVAISAQITNIESGLIVQSVNGSGYQTSAKTHGNFTVRGITVSQEDKKDPTLANAIAECIKELVYEIGQSVPAN